MTDWATVLVGAGGIVGTLAGVLIGKRSEHRSAHEAWLREKRLEIYAAVLTTDHTITQAVIDLVQGDPDERLEHFLETERRTRHLGSLVDQVRLLGPPSIHERVLGLLAAHHRVLTAVHGNREARRARRAKRDHRPSRHRPRRP